jgi:molybdate transport system ATP-binding protein
VLEVAIAVDRGDFALDVELSCPPGITCVMGPSGSGKSTILGVLAGLVVPTRGRVALDGEVWLDRARGIDVPVHARRLSYVFQGLALFPHMSALQNVTYALQDLPRRERAERAHALLAKVGVDHLAARKPRTLSGGEAQRVALARALARQPRLLLFDEPFSALDRGLRDQLVELVRGLVAELGVPMVHVTHSAGEARALADQVVRLERGKVVARGKAAELLAAPLDE